jgi:hypothetical protein
MNDKNVLITGAPRSGTTLTCQLLNLLPDVLALAEPMRVKAFAHLPDHEAVCRAIADFFDCQRMSVHERRRASSRLVDRTVPDNWFGGSRTAAGFRPNVSIRGEVVVDKELPPDYLLAVKHVAAFTAILDTAVTHFPVYAVVRNPLATLASWNSVDATAGLGRVPAAERLDPELAARLATIDDQVDRQIFLLGWFHARFRRHLPERCIIRYESMIASGGAALSVIWPAAARLAERLENQNSSGLYDHQAMLALGERLLRSDGAVWELYSRESVEDLLEELRVRPALAVPPAQSARLREDSR